MIFAASVSHILIPVIIGVSILLMLIRPKNIPEVYWIGAGVVLLLALRLIDLHVTGRALAKSLDVCLFLIGMMLLSELAREHGVFDWLSSVAIRRAGGSCAKLFTLVYAIGTVVTVLMSNDATAVVLTPAILAAVRKAKVQPLPYLFVCAFIANAASFLLPISNPANLVVFHDAMPPLAKWLLAFGVPCLLSIAATYLVMRWVFRAELSERIEHAVPEINLNHNGKIVVAAIALVIVVLLGASSAGMDLGLPTCLAAVAITAIICIKERSNPLTLAREISWETLALVGGLFVMVDAMDAIGAMNYTQQWLTYAQNMGSTIGGFVTGFSVGAANNLVNNLPVGLIAGSTLHAAHASPAITDAVLIGVDLGPNLSITGSLATILWLIALRREKVDVGFWDFFRIGVVAMPVAMVVSLGGVLMVRGLFHL